MSGTGVLIGDGPVVEADETRPRGRPMGVLCARRVRSEAGVLAEAGPRLEVVVARFPYVWGPGDTLTPALGAAVRAGRFRWIGGGRHLFHRPCGERRPGPAPGARRGRPGEIYWFTDGEPVALRAFFEAHIRALGLTPPSREISFAPARRAADVLFTLRRLLGRRTPPPLTPTLVRFTGQEITVVDHKARRTLGYDPIIGPEHLAALIAGSGLATGARPRRQAS